jgi:predicted Zn-dependent protease
MVKEQIGQLEQADTAAQRYLAQAPNDIAAYDITARILFDKHGPDLVIKTLKPFTETGKADKGTYELLGEAYTATGQPQSALEAYQNAQILAPNDVAVQTSLASLRVDIGEPRIAMTDPERTLAMAPKAPQVGGRCS